MENNELKRSLNLVDATLLVAGSMIGSGIFIVSADMSRTVGGAGWMLLLWVLTGIITLFAALSYGELAGMMPKAGGQFVYIQKAWGDVTAFLYGWSVFTVIQSGVIAAVAVAFAKFTSVFIPFFSPSNILLDLGFLKISSAQILAICSLILLTYINYRGLKNGKMIQLFFTSAKLIALFALIVFGLYFGLKTDVWSQNIANAWQGASYTNLDGVLTVKNLSGMALILALGTAIIGSLFSSDAWNNVTFIAGEIQNPKRNIPLSLLFGTSIVTIIYVLANITYLTLLPMKGSPIGTDVMSQGIMFAGGGTDRVGTAAASILFGDTALFVMALLIMISTFGCNSGLILSGARVYYAMANEGLFFKKAGTLNKYDVPGYALIVQCIWASVLCLSGSYGDLLDYCTFVSLIFYIVTIAGIFILRKKEPNAERPYKVIGYPLVPILYILMAGAICLILMYTKSGNTGKGLVIVLLGLPIYYFLKKKNAH
jgi:basic amino acid/polyamine antiporter, APA family